MKILKYLLFLLLILFIAGSIYVATKEGDFQLEETRVIPAPAGLLFKEVNEIPNWKEWSYWGSEEDMNVVMKSTSSGEGSGFSWENSQMGDGSITTEAVIPNKSLDQQLVLDGSISDITANLYWKFEPEEEGTRVTWGVKDDLNFKEKLALTLGDGSLTSLLQPKLERGLENLEEQVLRKMEEYSINVDGVTKHGGGFYMYMTTATRTPDIYSKAGDMIEQVSLFMRSNNISIDGKPFILYNQRDERSDTSIFSAAVPTPSQIITPEGSSVVSGFLPAQKSVKITLKGDFKNAPEAWQEGYRYIEENGLEVNSEAAPFEVFYNNPDVDENPAMWLTEIYIPVL